MNLLQSTLDFFRRERIWVLLFVFILLVFVYLTFQPKRTDTGEDSEALRRFQAAEYRLKEEIRATGGMQQFLVKRPSLLLAFEILSLSLVVILIVGLVIDFFWLTRPALRNRIQLATGPPVGGQWGLAALFKTVVLFILMSLALSLLLALLKSVVLKDVNPNLLVLTHTTLSDVGCIALAVYFVARGGGDWRDLGFKGRAFWEDLRIGLTGYVAVLPLFLLTLVGLVVVVQIFAYEPPPHPLVEVFLEEERSPAILAYSVFLACVAGPVLEEIFFRGFCYPALKKRWGVGWGLVLSAAFFSAIHQNLFAFLPVFILGLGLGYLYEKRGSLIPSIALHVVHNSVFILYFFLAKEILSRGV